MLLGQLTIPYDEPLVKAYKQQAYLSSAVRAKERALRHENELHIVAKQCDEVSRVVKALPQVISLVS